MLLDKNIRRLFFAVDAPIEASEFIDINYNHNYPKQFKWMRKQNLHLTIFFIGNTPAKLFDELFLKSKEIISNYTSFTLYPENICLMPSKNPRMIWIKYQTHPIFTALNNELHAELKKFQLQNTPTYKEPIPHITLARFYGLKNKISLLNFTPINLSPIIINKVQLWETETSPFQSNYSQYSEIIYLK